MRKFVLNLQKNSSVTMLQNQKKLNQSNTVYHDQTSALSLKRKNVKQQHVKSLFLYILNMNKEKGETVAE